MRTCPQAQRSRSPDMLTWCATPHRFGSMYRLSSVSNGRSVLCGGLMASCEQVCCVRWGACSYRVPTAQRAVGVWCTPQIVVPTWIMSSLGLTDSAAAAARTDDDTAVSLLPKVAIERVELDTLFKVRGSVAGEHAAHLSYVRPLRGWLWVTCVLRHQVVFQPVSESWGYTDDPKKFLEQFTQQFVCMSPGQLVVSANPTSGKVRCCWPRHAITQLCSVLTVMAMQAEHVYIHSINGVEGADVDGGTFVVGAATFTSFYALVRRLAWPIFVPRRGSIHCTTRGHRWMSRCAPHCVLRCRRLTAQRGSATTGSDHRLGAGVHRVHDHMAASARPHGKRHRAQRTHGV